MADVIPDYITQLNADTVTVRLGRPTAINGQQGVLTQHSRLILCQMAIHQCWI